MIRIIGLFRFESKFDNSFYTDIQHLMNYSNFIILFQLRFFNCFTFTEMYKILMGI